MSLTSKRIYQFGQFELKVSARLLVREGKPVQLGSRAFEILTCLVMRAGEVVTKDELLKTVWPDSFVEEGNLSQHIFALRKALGDQSTYIVTVPGKGYQFTEPVSHTVDEIPLPPSTSGSFLLQRTRERTHIVIEDTAPPSTATLSQMEGAIRHDLAGNHFTSDQPTVPLAALPHPHRRAQTSLWTVAALSVLALLAGWFVFRRPVRAMPTNQKVVLADLDNHTNDPELDDVLRKALEIDLDQSPYIDVMSEPEALSTLRLMGRKPETEFIPAVARELCERSNRQVLITGSIASVGQKYLLTLEATNCDSGKMLAGAKAEAASEDETLAALDSASATLRQGLGESAESLERFQVPIAQATTSSLEALKQYSTGEYLLGRMGKEESEVLPFFQRAAELDPKFAMAQVAIATSYYSLGEVQMAAPYYRKAFDLSNGVSEKERLYIRAHYYADDRRDVSEGIQAYQTWAEVYPRDWGPWLNIANEETQLGQYDAAIAAAQHALSLDPSRGIIYSVLAIDYMHVGRYGDAESTAMHALSIGKDSYQLEATLFETALLQGNRKEIDRQVDASEGKQGQWELLDLQALAAAKDGRFKHSEELFTQAYDAAINESLPEKADDILVDQASAEFECGMPVQARTTLLRVHQQHENPEASFLRAELGEIAPAEHDIADHGNPAGSDTLDTYVYKPSIRAEIALDQSKPLQALAELRSAADYDFAAGFAIPAERGHAYLAARQPEQAAREYQKILDHPGVDPVSPLFPLAWLGLARAESQAGHLDQSKTDYEKLFALWNDADPDLPILLAAHKEYASLGAPHQEIALAK